MNPKIERVGNLIITDGSKKQEHLSLKNLNKMKQLIKLMLGLLITMTVFQSCEKSEADSSDNSLSPKINAKQLEFVGIEHNKMLDEVYNYIKSESIDEKTGKSKIENFLISKISSNNEYSHQSNKIGINYAKDVFSKKINLNYQLKSANKSTNGLTDNYVARLDEILTNIDFNNNSVLDAINFLEQEIEQNENLTDEDMITLLSATQVSRYSYNYWSENWVNWLALADESKSSRNKSAKSAGGNIVKGDVAGAIGGAAGAWAVNVIPGAGQVAYGGAIVGAGVAGSVGVAVYEVFSYFGW